MSPRRPAGESRAAILAAARSSFGEVGFERTTIRRVARAAGVDPALVMQYFGSKEALLDASLQFPVDLPSVLEGIEPGPEIGTEIVRRALTAWEAPGVQTAIRGLLRTGASHERAAAALAQLVSRGVLPYVARLAAPEDAIMRSALVGSTLGGLALGRLVLRIPALVEPSPEQLARAVGPTITRYLRGDLS